LVSIFGGEWERGRGREGEGMRGRQGEKAKSAFRCKIFIEIQAMYDNPSARE